MKHPLSLLAAALLIASPAFALSETESSAIVHLRQEEKVAHDVYVALYKAHNLRPFSNIAASEKRHMEAMASLLKQHGIPDNTPDAPGKFTIPALQSLHDTLLARGIKSPADAYAVGVLIEETDIADLDALLKSTSDVTIRSTAESLRAASVKHLAAFKRHTGASTNLSNAL